MRRPVLPAVSKLGLLCVFAALFACADEGNNGISPINGPEEHLVEVAGDVLPLQITPDPVVVRMRDLIGWYRTGTADTLKINVSGMPAVAADVIIAIGSDTAFILIPAGIPAGEYKYSVTLKFGADSVFVDPRIIVGEG